MTNKETLKDFKDWGSEEFIDFYLNTPPKVESRTGEPVSSLSKERFLEMLDYLIDLDPPEEHNIKKSAIFSLYIRLGLGNGITVLEGESPLHNEKCLKV